MRLLILIGWRAFLMVCVALVLAVAVFLAVVDPSKGSTLHHHRQWIPGTYTCVAVTRMGGVRVGCFIWNTGHWKGQPYWQCLVNPLTNPPSVVRCHAAR